MIRYVNNPVDYRSNLKLIPHIEHEKEAQRKIQ